MGRSKNKKGWFHHLCKKKKHGEDYDSTHEEDEEEEVTEEAEVDDGSGISAHELRQHVAMECDFGVLATTAISLLFAGFAQCLVIAGITTIVPNVVPANTPQLLLIPFQGVFVFEAYWMMAAAVAHYDADGKLLLLSAIIPLLSSDKRLLFGWFKRKHRWHDLGRALFSRAVAMAGLLGGYFVGAFLVGWLNGSTSQLGNPPTQFDGVGPYSPIQVYAMIGTGYVFTYLTFGSHKMVTEYGHIRKWIHLLKFNEHPDPAAVFAFALMSSLQYMFNVLLTGSHLQFELMIVGQALTTDDEHYASWFAAELIGLSIAFGLLFFSYHAWAYYTHHARHVKIKK